MKPIDQKMSAGAARQRIGHADSVHAAHMAYLEAVSENGIDSAEAMAARLFLGEIARRSHF